jgi:Tol biopolymer transport system component
MPLAPATQLGPYEIVAPLGAGGMGEVYRARDTRLDRIVAIKILPAQLSSDPLRKQRFEREAKTISSLNHPHICVLHDVGHQDGVDYLVMECVEGSTLAKRLEKGPLPLDQVLKYGAHIADGLDKAHRSGVVHRDLKPGNIMLTPTGAKLLDFGLAKQVVPLGASATLTATAHTPVSSSPVTQEGTIVGTFQYMSPEQVEGKDLDGRSDIFSFGAVLYEMVTGKCAFGGKSQLSVASAILEKEPTPITAVNPALPPALDHVIRKCLAKNPDERWQSAADIKHELDWIAQSSSDSSSAFGAIGKTAKRRGGLSYAIATAAIVLALAVGAAVSYFFFHRSTTEPVVRAVLPPPANVMLWTLGDNSGGTVVSHDGRNVAFPGMTDGKQILFVRSLDTGEVKSLRGTENGKFPFWSPDGKSLGFFADQQLKRIDIAGGPPVSLAPAQDGRGGSWAGDTIVFSPYIYETIYRVPASSGKPVSATTMDRSVHSTHRWPRFLPDGKHFLYLAANHMAGKEESSGIYAGSIDGGPGKFILKTAGNAFYSSGYLLYFREGSLMAQEFDPDRLELKGAATPIAAVLEDKGNWGVMASASDNGVLVFQSPGEVKYPTSWFDLTGHLKGLAPISGELQDLRVSPDGTRVASAVFDGPAADIFVSDLRTGVGTRLTFGEDVWFVVWSPDGTKVAYSSRVANTDRTKIYVKNADGSGSRDDLLDSGSIDHPSDWTRDGQYFVFDRGELSNQQIWIMPLKGERKPFPLPNTSGDVSSGRVSPDGKWIAYDSTQSGKDGIFITSFPKGEGKWEVSAGGVLAPPAAWSSDGKELYFVGGGGDMMAASIQESPGSLAIQSVRPLFRSPFLSGMVRQMFDVSPKNGQGFIGSAVPDTTSLTLNVITNWTAELKRQ